MKLTTVKGSIRIGKVQTGWSVEKQGKEWVLLNFDDEIVTTQKTKKACLAHYASWYMH